MPLPGDSVTDTDLEQEPVVDDAADGDEYEGDDTDVTDSETPEDPFAPYGGPDEVKAAVDWYKRANDPEGALETFFALGRSMGLGVREIENLFYAQQGQQAPAQPEPQAPGPADDDVMTYADFKKYMAEMQEQVQQPIQQLQRQQQFERAQQTVQSTIQQLGIEDDATKAAVLQLGDRYLGDDLSPQNVANAVRRGHADFIALVQANADKYRKQKAAQAKSVPKAPKGGGPAGVEPEPEPRDIKEAIARARKKLMAQS